MGVLGFLAPAKVVQAKKSGAGGGARAGINLFEVPDSDQCTIAIDCHTCLHRICARPLVAKALVLRSPPDYAAAATAVVEACLAPVAQRGKFRTVFCVFDGKPPPAKGSTKSVRRQKAEKAMAAVTAAVASERDEEDFIGDIVDAAPLFINSKLVKACVDCIRNSGYDKLRAVVAPFEADSQLLHMARPGGQADYVLTIDSDLVVCGALNVLMMPPPGPRTAPLDFMTGNSVHLFKFVDQQAGAAIAAEQLDARLADSNPPATNSPEELALWLGGILHKHGIFGQQVAGAVVGCDYSSIAGAGWATVAPALYKAAGSETAIIGAVAEACAKKVERAYGATIMAAYQVEIEEGEEDEAVAAEPAAAAGGGAARAAARRPRSGSRPAALDLAGVIALTIRRSVATFRHALAVDLVTKKVVVAGSGSGVPLDRTALAAPRPDLGGKTLESLVGTPPTDEVGWQIACGTVDAIDETDVTDWHDADLHTVVVEAEMVVGARLQPDAINERWEDLTAAGKAAAAVLGLSDRAAWRGRFDRDYRSFAELSGEEQTAATVLGFDEWEMWPPRDTSSATAVEAGFDVDRLKRFLKCRDEHLDGRWKAKADMAKLVASKIEEEAELLRRCGPRAVHIYSPEGHGYVDLQAAKDVLDRKAYAREALTPPVAAEFERDVGKFRKTAAYVPEELTFGALNGDLDTGDERSREIDDSYVRVANLRDPGRLRFGHTTNEHGHWFDMQCPASMFAQAGEDETPAERDKLTPATYTVTICLQCRQPTGDDDAMQVPTAYWLRYWSCPCDYGADQCIHVRAALITAHTIPRPDDLGVPPPPTFVENGWKRGAAGASYTIWSPLPDSPVINSSLARAKMRQAKGKERQPRSVNLAGAAMQHWDPRPVIMGPPPEWASERAVEMRSVLWGATKVANGQSSAHERLFHDRMPSEPASQAAKMAGAALREFWTLETELSHQREAATLAAAAAAREAAAAAAAAQALQAAVAARASRSRRLRQPSARGAAAAADQAAADRAAPRARRAGPAVAIAVAAATAAAQASTAKSRKTGKRKAAAGPKRGRGKQRVNKD